MKRQDVFKIGEWTLTKKNIIKLIRLRLKNQKHPATITKIKIITITQKEYLGVQYNLYSKEYRAEQAGIYFNKMYLNEFKFLEAINK